MGACRGKKEMHRFPDASPCRFFIGYNFRCFFIFSVGLKPTILIRNKSDTLLESGS